MIEPEFPGFLQLGGGPRGPEDLTAHRMGHLHRRRTDPAADCVDQDPFSGPDRGLTFERVLGGDERLGHGRRRFEIEVARDRHGHPLGTDDVLGEATPADDPENTVANPERTGCVGAEGVHLPGKLQPGDVGGNARRGRIMSLRLKNVRPVQPAGVDPDANPVTSRLGRRDFANLQRAEVARTGDDDGPHRRILSATKD